MVRVLLTYEYLDLSYSRRCWRASSGVGARSRLVRGLVFKTNGGFLMGVSAGSIPVRFRQATFKGVTGACL